MAIEYSWRPAVNDLIPLYLLGRMALGPLWLGVIRLSPGGARCRTAGTHHRDRSNNIAFFTAN